MLLKYNPHLVLLGLVGLLSSLENVQAKSAKMRRKQLQSGDLFAINPCSIQYS